jgi:sulfoxide reductase heme-binding subunit YedZ
MIAATQLWWDTARAGGIVSWCLLAAGVLWGLAISTKATLGRVRPNWMLDLHRFLGGLAVVFVAVHVASLVLDSFVHFGLTELLVPLASDWHPVAVAWGVVGLYLLLAVELTSLARRRLPKRVWHGFHVLSYPTFALATIHGLSAGTDRHNPVWQLVVWTTVAAIAVLTAARLVGLEQQPPRPRFPEPPAGRRPTLPTSTPPVTWAPPTAGPPAGPPLQRPSRGTVGQTWSASPPR